MNAGAVVLIVVLLLVAVLALAVLRSGSGHPRPPVDHPGDVLVDQDDAGELVDQDDGAELVDQALALLGIAILTVLLTNSESVADVIRATANNPTT